MRKPNKAFVVHSLVQMGVVLDFWPQEHFRSENSAGLGLIVRDSFKECFLRHPQKIEYIPPCEIRGLQPRIDDPADDEIFQLLGEKTKFQLPHLFHLLVSEPKEGEKAVLKNAANFFFIPTPDGTRRVYAIYVEQEKKWRLGANRINTPWRCRGIDQIFAYTSMTPR